MGKSGLFLFLFLVIGTSVVVLPAQGRGLPAPGPVLPASLRSKLQEDCSRDDLKSWIYDQLQWVAENAGARSNQLNGAVQSAWRSPRNDQENQAWLDLLVNEGYALLRAGNIVRSTDAYTAALQFARYHEAVADETLILNNILKPLGNNYTRLGDYEEADFIHHKALSIGIRLNNRAALAGTYSNLANTASNRGFPQQALEYCKLGLGVVAQNSPYCGLLLSEQADALRQLGRVGEALTSIRKAIDLLEAAKSQPGVPGWLLVAYQQAGDIDSADPGAAMRYYLMANTFVQRGSASPREAAKLFFRLAEWHRRMGESASAIQWQDACLSALLPGKSFSTLRESDLYAENTLADVLYTRALLNPVDGNNIYSGDHPSAFSCFRLSFSVERLLRQQLITGSSKEGAVSESRQRHEAAIAAAYAANDKKAVLEFMESSKAQLLLDEQQQRKRELDIRANLSDSVHRRIRMLEKALIYYQEELVRAGANDSLTAVLTGQRRETERELAVFLKGGMGPHEAEADAVARNWRPTEGVQIRSFFSGTSALYQVGIEHSGIVFADKLPLGIGWQDSVHEFLNRWYERGPQNMIDRPRQYFDQAYALYRDLFAAHPLQPGKHYIMLTDGSLDLLPMEALPTTNTYSASPEGWPLVVRQTEIAYAWSMQTLGEAGQIPANTTGFTGLFIAENRRQLPALRAVAMEREGIARSIHRGEWLIDTQATCGAFDSALAQSAVVHVSAHAFSGRYTDSVPRIELADSPFYIFHLSEMQRHPALVVLSACRTGDGRVVTGEGVQSMARAFTAAGTNGVITGWWNVHDEVAAQLIGRFYAELGKGLPAADALSAAKKTWLADPAVPYLEKLPWYWAALNYQGANIALPAVFYKDAVGRRFPFWWLLWILPIIALAFLFYRGRNRP